MKKMSKAIEENKLTVLMKRFSQEFYLYCKLSRIKENLPPLPLPSHPSTPVAVFLIAEKLL